MSGRIYVYKCVVDDGGAPCVDNELLTLTICKPYIRSTARTGDLIFAFGSNQENPPNRLVYIAQVSKRLTKGKYFETDDYAKRQDCIYEWVDGRRIVRRKNAKFHKDERARVSDLGDEPCYPKANALVAEDFRYFGRNGCNDWKSGAPNLCSMVEGLGQGHRVNFSAALLDELNSLKRKIWIQNPTKKVLGEPLHAPDEIIDLDSDAMVKVCKRRCYYVSTLKNC